MQHSRTLRPVHLLLRGALACALVALAACGDGRNLHKVYPVKGRILVNGQPANECQIVLNRTSDIPNPVTPQALTDANGEFEITSYFANDGAPEGEYIATITWRERSGVTKQDFDGPDRLGGAYAKVEKTKGLPGFVLKVEKKPLDIPPFELAQSAEMRRKIEEAKKRKPSLGGGPLGSSN
jgi:hypothetical protein